ncbi:hypothetical protein SEA_CAMERICO_74 [Gordonia phage Camerico]|nr:hypothetical protein SEA_CAMERICO_74 [Gordonia phage Camerico]
MSKMTPVELFELNAALENCGIILDAYAQAELIANMAATPYGSLMDSISAHNKQSVADANRQRNKNAEYFLILANTALHQVREFSKLYVRYTEECNRDNSGLRGRVVSVRTAGELGIFNIGKNDSGGYLGYISLNGEPIKIASIMVDRVRAMDMTVRKLQRLAEEIENL